MRQVRTGWVLVGLVAGSAWVVACGDDTPATPTTTATVTATAPATATTPAPTETPSPDELAAEVADAYLAYWDAYADAVLHLDVTRVEGFAAGAELEGIRDEIETLRADGVAARIRVEHDFAVVSVTETEAVVEDEYVNNSFYVDAETKEPEEADGPGDVFRDTVLMQRVEGRWVVVQGSREAIESP